MSELNERIRDIPIPPRMQILPISPRGFPIPWFVAQVNGEYDFRVIGPGKIAEAHNRRRCWLCGQPRGSYKTFVIGPMCTVNRISSEPPSHLSCAQYAAKACPFLTQPRMRRNEKGLAELGENQIAGIPIARNPSVVALWTTKQYSLMDAGNGVLFRVGPPENVIWYAEGRQATRAEVEASIASGMPLLEAEAQREGPPALRELADLAEQAREYLPAA